jgi:dihydropteroate synthase
LTSSGSTARSQRLEIELPSGPFSLARVRVMGILNRTPDSFYDGGRYRELDRAVRRAVQMVEEGADIIDVGGEKAGPGDPVAEEEELERVVPTIEAIKREVPIPISVDTRRPAVSRAAVDAGVEVINSIGGFDDPGMRQVAADTGAAIVIMHIKGLPRIANPNPHYDDVLPEVSRFLLDRAQLCRADGIAANRIVVDPGPGFGKTTEHDLQIVRGLERLTSLPYPVLLAASRKRFIGEILGSGVEERLEGSLAVIAWGVLKGVKIVRVHDVRASRRVCSMVEAVLNPELAAGL